MNVEIFIPVFYMVLLTFSVSLIGTIVRFKNVLIDKKHTGIEMMKFSPPSSATEIIKQADRNLTNLFEFPILFYAIYLCRDTGHGWSFLFNFEDTCNFANYYCNHCLMPFDSHAK